MGAEVKREVGPELFEGDLAPLTRQLLFVNAPLKRVVRQQLRMSKEFGKVAKARRAPRQLRQALMTLEAVCLSGDRNLFFATQNPQWTQCGATFPAATMEPTRSTLWPFAWASPAFRWDTALTSSWPTPPLRDDRTAGDQLGARTWSDYSPLADYSAALGVRPFDEDFYSGPGFMVEESNPRRLIAESRGQRRVLDRYTLAEARARLGLGVVFPSEVSQPVTVDTFEDIDDLRRMRTALPVQISTATPKPGGANLKGPGWYMDIDCDAAWQGGAALGADDWAGLGGDTLTGVDGPADLFDPTLTFASGKIVVLDAGDESPPWYFVSGDVEIDAPGYNSRQDWLAGNIGDEI